MFVESIMVTSKLGESCIRCEVIEPTDSKAIFQQMLYSFYY